MIDYTQLADIATIFSGYAFKSKDLTDSGIPVIKIANIQNKIVLRNCPTFLPPELLSKKFKRYILQQNDILVAMTGAGSLGKIGKMSFVDQQYLVNQRVGIIRPNLDACEPLYIYYVLSQQKYEAEMYSIGLGAGQPNISPKQIGRLQIPTPARKIQQGVASILAAYDDLIGNNTRRIQILEEMAQRIYTEWFVHFRFPGHERIKMVDSDLGKIPSGWKLLPLGDVLKKHIGGGWGNEIADNIHTIPAFVIRGTDLPKISVGDTSDCPFRFHKISNFKSRKLEQLDIVFEASGGSHDQNVGRTAIITNDLLLSLKQNVICASFCKLIRVDKSIISPFQILFHLRNLYNTGDIAEYQVQSTGIKNFQFKSFIERHVIEIPPHDIRARFDDVVEPINSMIVLLGTKNTNLRQTRDLLLPKLISGEIDVSEMPDPQEVIAAA